MGLKLKRIVLVLLPAGLAFVSCGCNFCYLVHCGIGQARVLTHTVPLVKALKDPSLSPEEQDKLRWVQQVRRYAQDVIGLKTGKSYLSFYDTHGRPAVYNFSACRKDALQPYSWSFPIVGKIQYLGYFDLAVAERHTCQLEKQGYDTFIYGADAYSTAGWLSDPLFSSLLKLDKPDLAETVIHELTHNTVFKPGDSDFNESVTNFVGRKGAMEFLASIGGKESKLYRQAVEEAEDRDRINEFLGGVYRDLDTFYRRTDLSSAEKIAQRDQIFLSYREKFKTQCLPRFHYPEKVKAWGDLPVNNARIVLHRRYNRDMDIFEKVYHANQRDLRKTVVIFEQAAQSANAGRYLQDWLKKPSKN